MPRGADFIGCVCFKIVLWPLERLERRQSRMSDLQGRAAIICVIFFDAVKLSCGSEVDLFGIE